MNRRDFIQLLGVALATPSVPAVESKTLTLTLKKAAPREVQVQPVAVAGFDPRMQYGMAVQIADRSSVEHAKNLVMGDARKHLPRGTKFYVLDGGAACVWAEGEPKEIDCLAWYYSPAQLTGPRLAQVIAEVTA